jgi:uncharacterized phage-like protein YoqJ
VFHPKHEYRNAEIRAGVIVGFCEFDKNPAIQVMEIKSDYSGIGFEIVTIAEGINSDLQIAPYNKYEGIISQADVVTKFDRLIQQKELELSDLKLKKKYFIDDYAKAFAEIVPTGGI